MPEPVSNAEVEDVLASIRRLVSEDKRVAPPQPAPDRPEAGKLVLTPALRVAEPEVDDLANTETRGAQSRRSDIPSVDSAAFSELSSEAAQGEMEGESDLPGAPLQSEEADRDFSDTDFAEAGDAETGDADANDAEPVDQDMLAAEHARLAAQLVAARTAEQDSETVSAPVEQSEARGAWDGDIAADEALTVHGDAAPQSLSNVLQRTVETELADALAQRAPAEPEPAQSAAVTPVSGEGTDPSSLGAKIAALEAAVWRRQDEWEPDGVAEAEPYSGTAPYAAPWEDMTETGADASDIAGAPEVEALSGPVSAQDEAIEDTDLLEEPALLDEEALRDLVAEIVRAELQGALGERITRNVRKLVRREIQRALAAHDLD